MNQIEQRILAYWAARYDTVEIATAISMPPAFVANTLARVLDRAQVAA